MIDAIDLPAVRVDWMWDTSVERVLADAPHLFGWAGCRRSTRFGA